MISIIISHPDFMTGIRTFSAYDKEKDKYCAVIPDKNSVMRINEEHLPVVFQELLLTEKDALKLKDMLNELLYKPTIAKETKE